MNTAFSKMAETWTLLLLLLSLFNPLLSGYPENGTHSTQDFNLTEETVLLTTPLSNSQDRKDDTYTTVATTGLDSHTTTEASTEMETIETTTNDREDSSTDQDHSHVTGSQQPTSRQSTAHSTTIEEKTTEMAEEVTSQSSTISWHETSTASITANDSAEPTDKPKPSTENIATTEARTETSPPAVTTATFETLAASTQRPEPSTSGLVNSTNSTAGALVPRRKPEGRPLVTRPPEIRTTAAGGHQFPADKGGLPCVTRRDGLVSQCLIAIASLAAVATIFIVCTTVLCTKLSSSKYRYRMSQAYGTEMVCISALLPDGNGSHGRPRIPKSNGALIPNVEDSEGDDLTLHSFLPETDRGS